MNPYGSDKVVDLVLGSAYPVVKYVSDNMETLIGLAESTDTLGVMYPDVQEVVSHMNSVVTVGNNIELLEAVRDGLPIPGSSGSGTIKVYGTSAGGDDSDILGINLLGIDGNVFEIEFFDIDPVDGGGREAFYTLAPSFVSGTIAETLRVFKIDESAAVEFEETSTNGLKFGPGFELSVDPGDGAVVVELLGGWVEPPSDGFAYVRVDGAWVQTDMWVPRLYSRGTGISLVSSGGHETNKLYLRKIKGHNGVSVTAATEDEDIMIGLTEAVAGNLGYPKDFGNFYQIPCGGAGTVSSATEVLPAFTANKFYAIPVFLHQAGALEGIRFNMDSATKPSSGQLEISIIAYHRSNDEARVIHCSQIPYSSTAGGDTNKTVSSAVDLEPGLYVLLVRTTVDASAMKMTTLRNDVTRTFDSSAQGRFCANLQFQRFSVAGFYETTTPMITADEVYLINQSLWTGVTVCPFIELVMTYPL